MPTGAAWHTLAYMDNDERVVTRLPKWLRERVQALAEAESRSEAAMTRILLFEAVNARATPADKITLA